MKRTLLPAYLLCLVVVSIAASGTTAKSPWLWTDEERLAARLDESARAMRLETAHKARSGEVRSMAASEAGEPVFDVLLGRDHPELFMPFEIFSIFTRAAFGKDDAVAVNVRRDAADRAVAIGLPADFLSVIAREAAPFLDLQREELRMHEQPARTGKDLLARAPKLRELEARQCAPRAEAMRRLRAIYGIRFDQFLYIVAAPGVFRELSKPDDPSELRFKEAGCR